MDFFQNKMSINCNKNKRIFIELFRLTSFFSPLNPIVSNLLLQAFFSNHLGPVQMGWFTSSYSSCRSWIG
jgi:hypothetical protein